MKKILTQCGILSQVLNFKSCPHDSIHDERAERKSSMILQGLGRQILNKAGVRIWWTEVPKSLPLPAFFVGVDVFHAPMVYDQKNKKRVRKASIAAIIVQVIRKDPSAEEHMIEIFSRTFSRSGGKTIFLPVASGNSIPDHSSHLRD